MTMNKSLIAKLYGITNCLEMQDRKELLSRKEDKSDACSVVTNDLPHIAQCTKNVTSFIDKSDKINYT